jgi:hypothetical protein
MKKYPALLERADWFEGIRKKKILQMTSWAHFGFSSISEMLGLTANTNLSA